MSTAAAAEETIETYDPNKLLDHLIKHLGLKNDAALAQKLHVASPVLSKIRHRKLAVGATLLISMHEESEISIKDLRQLMGDRRKHFRPIRPDEAAGA